MSLRTLSASLFCAALLTGCAAISEHFNSLEPSDAKPAMTLTGKGVQIFQCAVDDKGRYWRFVAPQATLIDSHGREVAKQGSEGNFYAKDGSILASRITSHKKAKSADSLPDILYTTTSRGKKGVLTGVRYVLRSDASEGKPLTACSAIQYGTRLNVPFTATYRFYR